MNEERRDAPPKNSTGTLELLKLIIPNRKIKYPIRFNKIISHQNISMEVKWVVVHKKPTTGHTGFPIRRSS